MPTNSTGGEPRRILFLLTGAIGDVVRALPLLSRVRHAYPNAHIAWAVEPKSAPILERHPWLDELIIYDRHRAPWSLLPFLKRLRSGRFDLVLDLQRHLKSGLFSLLCGASDRLGFAKGNTKEFNHLFSTRQIEPQPNLTLKLTQYQAFGNALGIAPTSIEFGLAASEQEQSRADALLRDTPAPLLGVILGSSWPSRIYFPDSIAAVVSVLTRSNGSQPLFPVLLGGATELELAENVIRAAPDTPMLNLAGKTGLRDLIAIFSRCAAAFGPDSGPMHIAAAVGCPVVSLWGATAPERSAPWGFSDLAIAGKIPCHPCYLRVCPIGRECMRRIAPEEVAFQVRRALHLHSQLTERLDVHDA